MYVAGCLINDIVLWIVFSDYSSLLFVYISVVSDTITTHSSPSFMKSGSRLSTNWSDSIRVLVLLVVPVHCVFNYKFVEV